ncbi:MAG: hypothetical protein FWF86_03490 [Clostridia bacterium]|nr:hypothetical protein [Clostridia bacterium]
MLEVPDVEGLLSIGGILPLSDGSVVIGGQVQYPGEYREGYMGGNVDLQYMVRNDAIAMQIDASGKELWRSRLGDPHADNYFNPVGLLSDGRILMWFVAEDSTFGDRFFIVGLDGVVEEMLPWRTLAAHFPPRSMVLMPESGYLGGDSTVVDFYYDYHTDQLEKSGLQYSREMTLLDFDLNVVWCKDMSPLGPAFGNNHYAVEVTDGIIMHGLGQTVVPDAASEQPLFFTSVVKLDKQTGEVLWQLTDEPRENGMGAWAITETQDGSLLFTGAYLEPGQLLDEDETLHTLTKVTGEGVPVWTKRYENIDTQMLYRIVPFQDGYLLLGSKWDKYYTYTLFYVDADGELLGALTIEPEEDRIPGWPSLMAAPDGTVYISGSITTPYDEETETRGDLIGSFLGILKSEYFSELE